MVRNVEILRQFELAYSRQDKADFLINLRLLDSLYKEARALGAFPLRDPLEGIQVDIRVARIINGIRKTA